MYSAYFSLLKHIFELCTFLIVYHYLSGRIENHKIIVQDFDISAGEIIRVSIGFLDKIL